ncbi:hypothetical protein [Mycobacterium sp.]|uniref:hypothetical protein n=1 Tax=Mycobacterium sp. TaxID=1785 RepID=UPI003C768701
MLSRPVHEQSNMADAATLAYGDFSQFVIVDRIGAVVETVSHLVGQNRRLTGPASPRRPGSSWLNVEAVAQTTRARSTSSTDTAGRPCSTTPGSTIIRESRHSQIRPSARLARASYLDGS